MSRSVNVVICPRFLLLEYPVTLPRRRSGLFGGRTQPVMTHLIESGKLTLDEVQEAERTLRALTKKEKQK